MRRKYYHRSSRENAVRVLEEGFCICDNPEQNHRGLHGGSPGVWLADIPLMPLQRYYPPEKWTLDRQHGTVQLQITLDATGKEMAEFEFKSEPFPGYREWLVPAPKLNSLVVEMRIISSLREIAEICGQPVVPLLKFLEAVSEDATQADIARSRAQPFGGLVGVSELVDWKKV